MHARPFRRPHAISTRALQFIGPKNGGGGTRAARGASSGRCRFRARTAWSRSSRAGDRRLHRRREADVFDYIRDQLDETNFFAFGIGSSVNRFLIEGVARAGLGEPFIVTEPGEADRGRGDVSPLHRLAGADRHRRDVQRLRRLRRGAGESSRSLCQPADRRLRQMARQARRDRSRSRGRRDAAPYRSVDRCRRRRCLTRIIAPCAISGRARASRPLRFRRRRRRTSSAWRDITSLGLTYGLLTRYTSFVAVQEIVRRTDGDAATWISRCRCRRA